MDELHMSIFAPSQSDSCGRERYTRDSVLSSKISKTLNHHSSFKRDGQHALFFRQILRQVFASKIITSRAQDLISELVLTSSCGKQNGSRWRPRTCRDMYRAQHRTPPESGKMACKDYSDILEHPTALYCMRCIPKGVQKFQFLKVTERTRPYGLGVVTNGLFHGKLDTWEAV